LKILNTKRAISAAYGRRFFWLSNRYHQDCSLPYRHLSPLNAAARHYFDKLLAGNRAIEEKLAYYRQMTATAPRRYLKRFRLK
jgi:hypothetical protein